MLRPDDAFMVFLNVCMHIRTCAYACMRRVNMCAYTRVCMCDVTTAEHREGFVSGQICIYKPIYFYVCIACLCFV
jgi:hypothetical protein